ncbi:hypothetical protein UlMin_012327 [Ulmus minor]
MYRGKLASTELFTILGGFISSLLFLVLLTIIGNFQETCGQRPDGVPVIVIAKVVALITASTIYRVCTTTCFLFSTVLLYEVNKLSGTPLFKS